MSVFSKYNQKFHQKMSNLIQIISLMMKIVDLNQLIFSVFKSS